MPESMTREVYLKQLDELVTAGRPLGLYVDAFVTSFVTADDLDSEHFTNHNENDVQEAVASTALRIYEGEEGDAPAEPAYGGN